MNHRDSKEQLAEGIYLLTEYHFARKSKTFKADVIGELLFNKTITGQEGANHVAKNVSRSVTSSIFSATAIQQVIGTSAGSLNNSGADEYATIENKCKDTDAGHGTRNRHMLHLRHKLTKVKNICNPFVQKVFHLKHNADPNIRDELGDIIEFNFERLFRFLVDMFGLREHAVADGIFVAIKGDGAKI